VVFGMGVVSGLVMAFQFGTNWSEFAYRTANFLGPVLSYEVVTAFFLEAAFLGVLLFGRNRVPAGLHLFSAVMVALGTFISSFWILSANSWMQTPAGFELRDGMVYVTSWSQAIFNASFPYRFAHMALASLLTGGFVVAGVSAYYVLRGHAVQASKPGPEDDPGDARGGGPAAAAGGRFPRPEHPGAPARQGGGHGGAWETREGLPLLLFAHPRPGQRDQPLRDRHPQAGQPDPHPRMGRRGPRPEGMGAEERPNVPIVFWAFRIMVGIGLLMILVALWGVLAAVRGPMEAGRASCGC
jgi:cytochrome bd ubiquinol oxidase subunit I